ncbi:MAG: hypothetical protein RJA70_4393 [Pseudomonadota bacterium]|jgi:methyl-accepting chemotaxis protein
MNLWNQRVPIALRMGGTIALIAVLCAAFMAYYFPSKYSALASQGLTDKAQVAAGIVAHEVSAALDFDDRQAFDPILAAMTVDKDFRFVGIFDERGKPIATRTIAGPQLGMSEQWLASVTPSASLATVLERPQGLEVHHPFKSEGGKRAVLVAGFSFDTINLQVKQARNEVLLASLALMVLGIALAYGVGRTVNKRIGRVVSTARHVALGAIISEEIADSTNDEIGDVIGSFNAMNRNFKQLSERVAEVANGNLSETLTLDGDLANALNRMVLSQRELVRQIGGTATQLNSSSGEFFANAKQQERGATTQSTAVEEVRKTLESLLRSARDIGATADDVLRSAERSQTNSQKVAERIATLSSHNRRIAEILEVIKDIANKSELLALNAGLEGTKAGEAGRGFSLVASQMQRLAENVMGAVRDIKELTATITESTESTVLATEESLKLATDTTRWARQIGLIIQQQQTGTEQATNAMEDVGEVAAQTVSGSKQIVDSATDLMNLSQTLQALVGRFKVGRSLASEERVIRDVRE